MAKLEGGCLCGNIRYSGQADPILTIVCNCTNCQKTSGGAFSLNVAVPKGSVEFQGDLAEYRDTTTGSGKPASRYFCASCGSPIMSESAVLEGVTILKAGTLDDTSWVKPTMQCYCDSAQDWLELGEAMQKFPKMPEM